MTYISPRAKILSRNVGGGDVVVLGPSIINEGTIVEPFVIIGHPIRSKLLGVRDKDSVIEHLMDEVSSGAIIGRNCIIRSNVIIYENVEIGDGVETGGHNALIRENTRVGANTRIGSGGVIIDGGHGDRQ